jgi:hypothetical protein
VVDPRHRHHQRDRERREVRVRAEQPAEVGGRALRLAPAAQQLAAGAVQRAGGELEVLAVLGERDLELHGGDRRVRLEERP